MRYDDGKCHICRRVPAAESHLYPMTTCVDCDETEAERAHDDYPMRPIVVTMTVCFAIGLLASLVIKAMVPG